ncbi:hypothetical protein, variant 3 [Capsaspora owczarzaki ATCC 30864]|uniref:Uncharacterized protein n=1 Tax=Capsaspora owczarzaki (strain ATCC 30864) TaxID=595528 RepID=A0A0D2WIR4_CAPO3|nr:hypothetical protein, variant 3 [Capsaspora owczarzaki ATCC 30864]
MQFRREREVGFGNSGLLGIVFQLLACAMRYTHCYTTTGTHGARHGARGQSRTVPKRRNCFKGGFCRIHQGAGYGCFLKCEAACVLRYATLTCIDIGLPAFCMYIVTWAESTQSLAFQLFKRNAEGTIRTLHEKNKTMSTQLLQLQESGTVQSQEMFRKVCALRYERKRKFEHADQHPFSSNALFVWVFFCLKEMATSTGIVDGRA